MGCCYFYFGDPRSAFFIFLGALFVFCLFVCFFLSFQSQFMGFALLIGTPSNRLFTCSKIIRVVIEKRFFKAKGLR